MWWLYQDILVYSNLRKAINNGEQTIVLIKHLGNYSEMKNLYEQD